jgi:hypothetical protein
LGARVYLEQSFKKRTNATCEEMDALFKTKAVRTKVAGTV